MQKFLKSVEILGKSSEWLPADISFTNFSKEMHKNTPV